MSDREAFQRAIAAAPADDTPRLVFADWLDDHGDPAWADLIRVQVELEPIHEELDNPRRRELADRETELLARHGDRWLGPVHDIAAEYPAYGPVFRRGLPESVSLSLDTFLARGGELFAACPTVREVCVYGVTGRGAELAACPHLAYVETLEIADWLDDADMAAIPRSWHLAGLRTARVWLSPGEGMHYDGWLLVQFHGRRDDRRPWRVEAVDVAGRGDRFGYRREFPDVAFTRPAEARFPIAGDVGHGLIAGRFRRGTPALAAVNPSGSAIATFDEDGRQRDDGGGAVRWFRTPAEGITPAALVGDGEAFDRGAIRVRAFGRDRPSGLGVRLWPAAYVRDYLTTPFERPPGVSDRWWSYRGGGLKRWLQDGRFVIEWDGRELWLDSSGTVIAS